MTLLLCTTPVSGPILKQDINLQNCLKRHCCPEQNLQLWPRLRHTLLARQSAPISLFWSGSCPCRDRWPEDTARAMHVTLYLSSKEIATESLLATAQPASAPPCLVSLSLAPLELPHAAKLPHAVQPLRRQPLALQSQLLDALVSDLRQHKLAGHRPKAAPRWGPCQAPAAAGCELRI